MEKFFERFLQVCFLVLCEKICKKDPVPGIFPAERLPDDANIAKNAGPWKKKSVIFLHKTKIRTPISRKVLFHGYF